MNKFIRSILVIISLCAGSASSQILTLHNYTMKDGLVSDNIQTISQDSLGYIWIGTGEGISVFDSKEFKNYFASDGLSSSKDNCIVADKNSPGVVWIGTNDEGINKFKDGKFKAFGSNLPSRMKIINTLFEDNNNTLWCGADSGIYFIQKNKIHFIHTMLNLGSINAFAQAVPGQIIIGTSNGLYKYFIKFDSLHLLLPNHYPSTGFTSVIAHNDGRVYCISNNALYRIDRSRVTKMTINQSPRVMVEDPYNNLWIGTFNGLVKVNKNFLPGDHYTIYTTKNGLLQNNTSALLVDRENILWIGSNDNGLSKLTYQNMTRFHIPGKYVNGGWVWTASDGKDRFWAAVNKHLIEIWKDKNQMWHEYYHFMGNDYPSVGIPYITIDKDNRLYITSPNHKIYVYSIKQNKLSPALASRLKLTEIIHIPLKLKFFSIYKIMVDKDGYVWCSALDLGIIVINKFKQRNVLKIYNGKDGIPDVSVRELFQDSNGNIWLGGFNKGLSVFSYAKILYDVQKKKSDGIIVSKLFTTKNGLPDNSIRAIIENKYGDIIIGTRSGGLAIYKNGSLLPGRAKFQIITRAHGLLSNAIWSITNSKNRKIWIGTQSGVQELSENGNPSFKLYDELPKIPYYSVCSSHNGIICLANLNDIYLYEPQKVEEKPIPPSVYITHLLINGEEVKIENNMRLQSNQNTITFKFIGIANREERNTIYEYRLLKADRTWNILRDRGSVTYAALNPGYYTFQVKAENGKKLQSKSTAEMHFIIIAPIYLQWWFILIVILILIGGIILAMRIRLKRLVEIEKIRTRIAADLHDEIGSGLTRIAVSTDVALKQIEMIVAGRESKSILGKHNEETNYSVKDLIKKVGKHSRELVDAMSDVVWSIDPKNTKLSDLLSHLRPYIFDICEAKNIFLEFHVDEKILGLEISPETLHALLLIAKEASNNAVKHSECNKLLVYLTIEENNITLKLMDNGKGFDVNKNTQGYGLINMMKRTKSVNGSFSVESTNKGTTISTVIPFKKLTGQMFS